VENMDLPGGISGVLEIERCYLDEIEDWLPDAGSLRFCVMGRVVEPADFAGTEIWRKDVLEKASCSTCGHTPRSLEEGISIVVNFIQQLGAEVENLEEVEEVVKQIQSAEPSLRMGFRTTTGQNGQVYLAWGSS
jgi:hypothetical protein